MNSSIKLKHFSIDNFNDIYDKLTVDFAEGNTSVIYGPNGSGKTSFLKAIHSFFSQDEDSISLLKIKEIRAKFLVNENEVEVSVHRNLETNIFTWKNQKILEEISSLSLGVERGVTTLPVKIPESYLYETIRTYLIRNQKIKDFNNSIVRDLSTLLATRITSFQRMNRRSVNDIDFSSKNAFLQNIKIENIESLLVDNYRVARYIASQRIQNALFETLSEAINIEEDTNSVFTGTVEIYDQNLVKNLISKKDRLIEALEDGDNNGFKIKIFDILQNINDEKIQEKITKNNLLKKLFLNMIKELDVEKLHLSAMNDLIDRFNEFLINNKKLKVTHEEACVELNGKFHSINDLSSGERHILTLLCLVLFKGKDRNILIIDEPEISLNVKWQRQLLKLFSDLLPEAQIIVASHSPFIPNHKNESLCNFKFN
ncbi:AAA family ATPase [Acinetobacter johnsonii]|uniref:AAA family ATPase n=1 Tax=Acinetobacter johnsonii TaxID=40214 RepID=UPI001F353AC9|nr:AAA family ATPase [Acinetobacter johnsonii]UIZ98218.1 AAA family ATPase [Acinetobacter johnsonii]